MTALCVFPRKAAASALLLFAAAGLAGCSADPPSSPVQSDLRAAALEFARPDPGALVDRADPARGLVDLGFGRLTRVEGMFRARTIPTGGVPGPWVEIVQTTERQVVGVQTPVGGGPTYRQERVRILEQTGPSTSYDLWRQDKSGLFLYQEDVAARTPRRAMPLAVASSRAGSSREAAAYARAWDQVAAKREALALAAGPPGGAGPHEITFLRYPLHRGATWEGRPGFNRWTVEENEWLETPAGRFHATRLRIELPEFFGPKDLALTWWDEPGEIRRAFHLFGDAVDDGGNVIGEVETLEEFVVVDYVPVAPIAN